MKVAAWNGSPGRFPKVNAGRPCKAKKPAHKGVSRVNPTKRPPGGETPTLCGGAKGEAAGK